MALNAFSLSKADLASLAADGYNRVPIAREFLADLETPLSAYLKLAGKPYSFVFESVHGGEKWGRYSIIGLPCSTRLSVQDHTLTVSDADHIIRQERVDQPLVEIERYLAQFRVPMLEGLPKFHGGLVGYFGFDSVRYLEPKLDAAFKDKPNPIQAPDILLMLAEELVVFDNLSGRLFVIVHVDPSKPKALDLAQERIDEITSCLHQPAAPRGYDQALASIDEAEFHSSFGEPEFKQAVERCKQYIVDGDIFQVVIAQQMSTEFQADPLDLYRALRTLNPSPYMYYLDMNGSHIAGSSPEILVRLEDGTITVRPIAGTRRRGHTPTEDKAMEAELLADPKELAEHLMLLDLGRNDVGRVAETGSVKVTQRNIIERYSHVMHIVSNVEAKLKADLGIADVLAATFPAGTVSGAPKIRALEIIDELEPIKRGVYSGAVGYLGWHGNLDTALAIRTAVVHQQTLYIQAGAGIVADSQPDLEWKETLNKARAVFKAASLANAGLDLSQQPTSHR